MKHKNGTFTLTKADAKALLSCASADLTRAHTGVRFDPYIGTVVASDGVTLMTVEHIATGNNNAKGFTVPTVALAKAIKPMRKRDRLTVTFDDERITLAAERPVKGFANKWEPLALCDETAIVCEPVNGVYPPWQSVVPARRSSEGTENVVHARLNLAFNPEYLLRSKLMLDAAEPRVKAGVRWSIPCGPLDPIRADCECSVTGVKWVLVVMPMRI